METERLLMRRFKPDDGKDLFEYLSDEKVVEFEPYLTFNCKEEVAKEAERRSHNDSWWAVCLKGCEKLIGNVCLFKQEFDTWELGYVFNANYWGKGYATEAVRTVIDNAFKNHNVRRIIAMCDPLNERSWKLLDRLGMRREGHLRQNIYFRKDEFDNPIWKDTYEYAILFDEWFG